MLEKLQADVKTAMKARDSERLTVLRMTISEIKNAKIEKGDDLSDVEVIAVIKKAIKSRHESAEQYAEAGRDDLATKEKGEAAMLEGYLPEQISGSALEKIVADAVAATGASSMKDMGGVMKAVLSKYGAQVNGKEVGDYVKKALSGG